LRFPPASWGVVSEKGQNAEILSARGKSWPRAKKNFLDRPARLGSIAGSSPPSRDAQMTSVARQLEPLLLKGPLDWTFIVF
jgi:hypothetical protein